MPIFKAQSSIEFLLSLSLYFTFIVIILFFISQQYEIDNYLSLRAEQLSNRITLSYISSSLTSLGEEEKIVIINNVIYLQKRGSLEKLNVISAERVKYG